ncbi:MAG: hypothetical protein H7831_06705 [Magnetococcus sp. WYHC-3]
MENHDQHIGPKALGHITAINELSIELTGNTYIWAIGDIVNPKVIPYIAVDITTHKFNTYGAFDYFKGIRPKPTKPTSNRRNRNRPPAKNNGLPAATTLWIGAMQKWVSTTVTAIIDGEHVYFIFYFQNDRTFPVLLGRAKDEYPFNKMLKNVLLNHTWPVKQ